MMTQEIIDGLKLEQKGLCEGLNGTYRIFDWPEYDRYEAKLRECSLAGFRLAKKNNVLLTFKGLNKEYRILLTNERLADQPETVRWLIEYLAM